MSPILTRHGILPDAAHVPGTACFAQAIAHAGGYRDALGLATFLPLLQGLFGFDSLTQGGARGLALPWAIVFRAFSPWSHQRESVFICGLNSTPHPGPPHEAPRPFPLPHWGRGWPVAG